MKFITSSFLALALSAIALTPGAMATTSSTSLTPFNIVSLAYQGKFNEGGIPGYAALEAGIRSGSVTAEDVIEAAITTGRLPASVREDSRFIDHVELQLDNLIDHN